MAQMTRREFIIAGAATSAVALLTGCKPGGPEGLINPVPQPKPPTQLPSTPQSEPTTITLTDLSEQDYKEQVEEIITSVRNMYYDYYGGQPYLSIHITDDDGLLEKLDNGYYGIPGLYAAIPGTVFLKVPPDADYLKLYFTIALGTGSREESSFKLENDDYYQYTIAGTNCRLIGLYGFTLVFETLDGFHQANDHIIEFGVNLVLATSLFPELKDKLKEQPLLYAVEQLTREILFQAGIHIDVLSNYLQTGNVTDFFTEVTNAGPNELSFAFNMMYLLYDMVRINPEDLDKAKRLLYRMRGPSSRA
ncbi:hypothetical protein H6764_02860 [Candidatus Nomurabacteria bacterium]|nr:hypothetical protein [Candidatus Nomurabacteria bacterium]